MWLPCGSDGKTSVCKAGDHGSIPGLGRPLEKGMATHSSILALRTSWTEEPGGLPSRGHQRVRHNWVTDTTSHGAHKPVDRRQLDLKVENTDSYLPYHRPIRRMSESWSHPLWTITTKLVTIIPKCRHTVLNSLVHRVPLCLAKQWVC